MIRRVPGENRDHPHHQSLWFNYGDVNGLDFWNAYHKDLRIRHKHASIDGNTLRLKLEWLEPDGAVLLTERRDVHFGGDIGGENGIWSMDHRITLTAGEKSVVFGDSKEGAFGLRLAASLRERDGTGRYLNAEGLETSSEVWGKPSAWVALTGEVAGGEGALDTTVAIFSHPTSLNHPPYWHARNYGLFAANPFGRKGYDRAAERRETRVEPGQSIRMRYLLVVADRKLDGETLNEIFTRYSTD